MRNQTTVARHHVSVPPARPAEPIADETETLELLARWAREDATGDPETLRAAQRDLDEFKRTMNENRAASGERILYP